MAKFIGELVYLESLDYDLLFANARNLTFEGKKCARANLTVLGTYSRKEKFPHTPQIYSGFHTCANRIKS